jgi:hypothetical protein
MRHCPWKETMLVPWSKSVPRQWVVIESGPNPELLGFLFYHVISSACTPSIMMPSAMGPSPKMGFIGLLDVDLRLLVS